MTIDRRLRIGETVTLGSHTFTAEEIKAFARKYDPQPFHLDEQAAERSVFKGLCASGWHTCATWMKYNLKSLDRAETALWDADHPRPEFGPSPGLENLKWLKPVYAGETITFTRCAVSHRKLASRPGWSMLRSVCAAFDSTGDQVLSFENSVLVKL